MDKMETATHEDLDKLKTRIDSLEKENRWFYSALELIASMGEIHREIPKSTDPTHVFETAQNLLRQLIPFKSMGFFLVNESDNKFVLQHGIPNDEFGRLKVELDHQIEKGNFAWALKHHRAMIVDSELFPEKILLHVLATKRRVIGMMMARLEPKVRRIPSELSTLTTIVMHNTAHALENGNLYRLLEEENKTLEQRVEERTREIDTLTVTLNKNIDELKDFAFIASHDLQEPLRKVILFGERLRHKYENRLDPRAMEYIQVMSNATGQMQQMVEGLMKLSRVTTKSWDLRTQSIERLIQETLKDIENRISRYGAEVLISQLPPLRVDASLIKQVFRELILNALKFSKPDVLPEITITSHSRDDGFWDIWVTDNGVGFKEKYLDRIFKPFERLYGKSEGEGIGLGLAICKKIVERHGGSLTAKSKPGEGSTFIITLPEEGPAAD